MSELVRLLSGSLVRAGVFRLIFRAPAWLAVLLVVAGAAAYVFVS